MKNADTTIHFSNFFCVTFSWVKTMCKSMKNIYIMHLSGAYNEQTFYKVDDVLTATNACQLPNPSITIIECRDITGTNCYCDDAAKEELRYRIADASAHGIHFLDSGNYHYLSLLWMEKITIPFDLILFDHHPDLQAPTWGGITSCGGWIREALETNAMLKNVYLIGVDTHLLEEAFSSLPGQLRARIHVGAPTDTASVRPVYISFDKDVLCKEDALCDWDQGSMTLREACVILDKIKKQYHSAGILGMDVCGEDAGWVHTQDAHTRDVNDASNASLRDFYLGL